MLKITKSRYLRNGLTDLYEIWYDDAKQVSSPLRPFNNLNFRNLRRRTDKLQFLYYLILKATVYPQCERRRMKTAQIIKKVILPTITSPECQRDAV